MLQGCKTKLRRMQAHHAEITAPTPRKANCVGLSEIAAQLRQSRGELADLLELHSRSELCQLSLHLRLPDQATTPV